MQREKDVNDKIEEKQSNQGITLIALVLTIIILMILAGITIGLLTGDNGILTKANEAKIQTIISGEKEQIALAYHAAMIETNGEQVKAEELQSRFNANKVDATAEEADLSIKVTFKDTGNNYWIEDNGNISDTEPMIPRKLEVGNYIYYPDKNGNQILCKVLYNNEKYGVQLVALNPVDTVKLGYKDTTIPENMASESNFEKAKYSYNNAIKTLNDKAEEYRNSKYTDKDGARCIGSVPDNPYSEVSDYFTSTELSYMSSYNGTFKNEDNNYNEDWGQLRNIGSQKITDTSKSDKYWISSRYVFSGSTVSGFYVRFVQVNGNFDAISLCYVTSDGLPNFQNYSFGFRPVFTLKPNVKIDNSNGKNGTSEETAYNLR